MIRRATNGDTERLVEMGMRFVDETGYGRLIKANPERLALTVAHVLSAPEGAAFVSEEAGRVTGMIGMITFDHPFSGERTASEVVWWVEPEARGQGVRLLRAAESWAREVGAKKMTMVAPNERIGALYERLGYAPIEISFQRSL